MFKGKDYGMFLFWIAFLFCGIVLGFVVKQAGSSKPEVGRADIVSDEAVMPSGVEASQRKGKPASGILRLALLAQDDDLVDAQDDVRSRLQQIYTSQIGVREVTGKNDGPQVEKYLAYTGIKTPSAWCAAFVSWVYGQAGMDQLKTAWSPALFPDNRLTSSPKTGDVFGIYFQELKRIAHCGFVDSWDGTWCITVEGNTNDVNSVISTNNTGNPIRAGPGEGVYRKKRAIKTIYKVANWIDPEGR